MLKLSERNFPPTFPPAFKNGPMPRQFGTGREEKVSGVGCRGVRPRRLPLDPLAQSQSD